MAKLKKAYTDKSRTHYHRYLFNIGGKIKPISAKVRPGKGTFALWLEAVHAKTSIRLGGPGNAQTCAGAICMKDHADKIPHKFTGYVDFWDTRAFLSCRNNAETNLPSHCVGWKHDRPDIAKLFDSREGRLILLKTLEENGPIKITFTVPVYQTGSDTSRKRGHKDPLKRKFRMGHNARISRVEDGVSSFKT